MVNGGLVRMSSCARRTRQTVIWVAAAMAVLSVLLWRALIRRLPLAAVASAWRVLCISGRALAETFVCGCGIDGAALAADSPRWKHCVDGTSSVVLCVYLCWVDSFESGIRMDVPASQLPTAMAWLPRLSIQAAALPLDGGDSVTPRGPSPPPDPKIGSPAAPLIPQLVNAGLAAGDRPRLALPSVVSPGPAESALAKGPLLLTSPRPELRNAADANTIRGSPDGTDASGVLLDTSLDGGSGTLPIRGSPNDADASGVLLDSSLGEGSDREEAPAAGGGARTRIGAEKAPTVAAGAGGDESDGIGPDEMILIAAQFARNANSYDKYLSVTGVAPKPIIGTSAELWELCQKTFPRIFAVHDKIQHKGPDFESIFALSTRKNKRGNRFIPFAPSKGRPIRELGIYFPSSKLRPNVLDALKIDIKIFETVMQMLAFRNLTQEEAKQIAPRFDERAGVAMWMLRFETIATDPEEIASADLLKFVMQFLKYVPSGLISRHPQKREFKAAFLEYAHLFEFRSKQGNPLFGPEDIGASTLAHMGILGTLPAKGIQNERILLQFCVNDNKRFVNWATERNQKPRKKKAVKYDARKILDYTDEEVKSFLNAKEISDGQRLKLFNAKIDQQIYALEESIWDAIVRSNGTLPNGRWFVNAFERKGDRTGDGNVRPVLRAISSKATEWDESQNFVLEVLPDGEEKRVMALSFFPRIQRWAVATTFELDPRGLGLLEPENPLPNVSESSPAAANDVRATARTSPGGTLVYNPGDGNLIARLNFSAFGPPGGKPTTGLVRYAEETDGVV